MKEYSKLQWTELQRGDGQMHSVRLTDNSGFCRYFLPFVSLSLVQNCPEEQTQFRRLKDKRNYLLETCGGWGSIQIHRPIQAQIQVQILTSPGTSKTTLGEAKESLGRNQKEAGTWWRTTGKEEFRSREGRLGEDRWAKPGQSEKEGK